MPLHLDKMTESTWINARGEALNVRDMADDHLSNTIRWLQRNAFPLRLRYLGEMDRYMQDAPDGAYDAAESAANDIIAMTDEQFLLFRVKPYAGMVREYARRTAGRK